MDRTYRSALGIAGVLAVVTLVGAVQSVPLHAAEPPAVKRNILMKKEMTVPGREGIMALVELPPGAAEGRHTHPAEVFAFVQEGQVLLEYEGTPDRTLKAGDTFYIAPGKVHQATNNGTVTAKLLAVFVAEAGKPLTAPAAK